MTVKEKAAAYHEKGFNCSQSVLAALSEETGLDETLSARLGTCFGGGMRCGNVCGAVTGGLMAIGCACMSGADPSAEKDRSTVLTHELEERFSAEMGSLLCAEILKANGRAVCPRCIGFAAEVTKEIIEKNR